MVGVSVNGGTPNLHIKMVIFSRKTHGCWVPLFLETSIYVLHTFCISLGIQSPSENGNGP